MSQEKRNRSCFFNPTVWLCYHVVSQNLQAVPEVKASCGQNVSLTCDASSSNGQLNIKLFSWLGKGTTWCRYKDNTTGAVCESTGNGSHHSLTLQLTNLDLSDQGQYLCKLLSTVGVKYATTVVTVQGRSEWHHHRRIKHSQKPYICLLLLFSFLKHLFHRLPWNTWLGSDQVSAYVLVHWSLSQRNRPLVSWRPEYNRAGQYHASGEQPRRLQCPEYLKYAERKRGSAV